MIATQVQITNPFVGLRSFEEDESHLFFGREQQVDELLLRLKAHHFLAVIGTSGSGKSSLIRAGLIPALKSGLMTKNGSNWEILICRIGKNPIESLAKKLSSKSLLATNSEDAADLKQHLLQIALSRSPISLSQLFEKYKLPANDNLLIVIDQFEEIFQYKSLGADQAEAAAGFIKLLLQASLFKSTGIHVVLTMRSDFIGHCAEMPGLIEAINASQYIVPRMTREQLRLAITGPVKVGNGFLTPALEKRLLNDIDDNPDHLPILQHAMMRMWDYWKGSQTIQESLDIYHYEAIGTMERALSMHAEEAYHDLNEQQASIAKLLFQAITERKGKEEGIRRPTEAGRIAKIAQTQLKDLKTVVDNFTQTGRSFLVTYGADHQKDELTEHTFVDISHESIMRLWGRLKGWVREEADSANTYLRLSQAAQLYEEGKSGLLQDPELSLSSKWYAQHNPTATWAERYDHTFMRAELFLLKSEEEKARIAANKEAQQKRSLKKAKLIALIFGLLSIISIVFLVYAIVAQVQANENLNTAKIEQKRAKDNELLALKEREKAMASEQEAFEQKEKAIVSANLAKEQSIIAKQNELKALANEKLAIANEKKAKAQTKIAEEQRVIAKNKAAEAEKSKNEAIESEKIAKQEKLKADTLRLRTLALTLAASSARIIEPEQKDLKGLLALESYQLNHEFKGTPNDPQVYEALFLANQAVNPQSQSLIEDHNEAVTAVAFSPDGNYYASGSIDGQIALRKVTNNSLEAPKMYECGNERCGIRDITFSTNGENFATAHQDHSVKLWKINNPKPTNLIGHTSIVRKVVFNPKNNLLLSADISGKILFWDPKKPVVPTQTIETNARITDMKVSPDGTKIYVVDETGYLKVYSSQGKELQSIATGLGKILATTPDWNNNRLILGNNDGKIIILDLKTLAQTDYIEHKSGITGLTINQDGSKLATVSLDNTMKVFDLVNLDKTPIELKANGWIYDVQFSPDGQSVVFCSADGKVRKAYTNTDLLAKEICQQLAGKQLSENEWKRYLGNDIPQGESPCN